MTGGARKSSGASGGVSQRSINSFFAPKRAKKAPGDEMIAKTTGAAEKEAVKRVSTELPVLTSTAKHDAENEQGAPILAHDNQTTPQKRSGPLQTSPAAVRNADPLRSSPRNIKSKEGPVSEMQLGARLLNKRLEIFWPADQAWYWGTVEKYDSATGKHTVLYDDETVEELVLADEKVRWSDGEEVGDHVNSPAVKSSPLGGRGLKRGRRKVTYLSEDDEEDVSDLKQEEKDADFVVNTNDATAQVSIPDVLRKPVSVLHSQEVLLL